MVIFSVFRLFARIKIKSGNQQHCFLKRIPIMNFISGLIGAVVIFGYLGYFSDLTQIPIEKLPISGPDLIFITIPAALSTLPFAQAWIVLFLFTLILIGIDSQLGIVETVVYIISDLKPNYRGQQISQDIVRITVCVCLFLVGIIYSTNGGFMVLNFVNDYCIFLPMTFNALLSIYIFGFMISLSRRLAKHDRSNRRS